VALVRAKYPQLKAPEVIRRITATATDKGAPGRDSEYGYGVLNLFAALTADLPVPTTAGPASSQVVTPSAPPLPSKSGFPWWLVAIPVVAVLGIAGFVVIRRRR
jgi:hypothetical protein